MKRLGFILFCIVVYPLLWLPTTALYVLSDLTYLVLYRLLKYRTTVVYTNLKNSFPEKSEAEIKAITKKFYKNLCDVFIEALKMTTISKKELERRVDIGDTAILEKFKSEGKRVIAVMGHFSNWEWCGYVMSAGFDIPLHVIYRPLKDPYFEKFFYRVRSRFGGHMVQMEDIYKTLLKHTEPSLSLFISDQSPPNTKATYWTNFLSQDTPVFLGAEKIGAKLNTPVIFLYTLRVKRGHYKNYYELLTEDPSKLTGSHAITELHVKFLEQLIRKYPEQWLWSHKRWKHRRIT